MRLIVGILLFVLCIITVPTLKATELGNELQPESTAPVETLEKEYVELDLTATETPSISIMQAVKSLTTLI
ncbi:MAG: hypothetical protein H7061_00250, partial [Bdellovibrionaceae bacterium]|nr:hypothetical protein [Bdellovibrio sp.]